MSGRTIVELRDVTLDLDGKRALDHVSWKVRSGENWAVIGPNGAGKTSLLSIINGYRWPSDGYVQVLGRTFGSADIRELKTEVGLVSSFLDDRIPKNEQVLQLVMSGKFGATKLWEKTDSRDRRQAESLLRLMGCAEESRKKVRELSQGERQKVVIARALMSKPRLLTLDEPCEGLDIGAREAFLASLGNLLARRLVTVIEITHRTEDIPAGLTHALLLRDGAVVGQGELPSTLTDSNLSRCYGVDVTLKRMGGRYFTLVRS